MPTLFGPYELLERLGEGGMAEVWSAKKRGSGGFERVVCIKRIRLDQRGEADMAERFLREARVLGRLHHVNIAQIYDAGQIDDEYFIEMEFLHGKDLRNVLKAQMSIGPPPPGLGISVAMDIGRALDHAHRLLGPDGKPSPVVHRDVTAANVMLGFDGSVKLVDFGLAKGPQKSSDPRVTSTGVFVGTVGYIAPEVVKGEAASAKSDQFSLGVVFYEALTGRRLLDPAVARERPPSECNAAIPEALDAVCLRALSDDPMKRFSSCGSFVNAIDGAAPQLGIGASGIAKLLTDRFGGSKLEASTSATIMRPAFVKTPAVVVAEEPAPSPSKPISLAAETQPDAPAAARSDTAKGHVKPAVAAKPKRQSNATMWIAVAGAAALLAAAIAYRLRAETPATPVVAPPVVTAPAPVVDAATVEQADEVVQPKTRQQRDLVDPFPTVEESKSDEDPTASNRKKPRDLMDPFPTADSRPKNKRRKKATSDEDLILRTPKF